MAREKSMSAHLFGDISVAISFTLDIWHAEGEAGRGAERGVGSGVT